MDPFEIFKSKTPEVLEETIFMKKRGESEDMASSVSNKASSHVQAPSPRIKETKPPQEPKDQTSNEFSKSIEAMLAKKKQNRNFEKPSAPAPTSNFQQNDLQSMRNFHDNVKRSLEDANSYGKFSIA